MQPDNAALLHGLFEAAAYAGGAVVYARERRNFNVLEPGQHLTVLVGAAAGALVGSRLLAGLADPATLAQHWREAGYWMSVKTIIGGLIGGWIGVEVAKGIERIRVRTGDRLVLPLIVAIAIGRVGCFLAGPADRTAGLPTAMPWGVRIGDSTPRHPVALYEIAFLGALALALGRPVAGRPPGWRFRVFLGAYLLFRVAVDFLKPEPPRVFAGLSLLQWAALAGSAAAFATLRAGAHAKAVAAA